MKLEYAVLTTVCRDDLEDQGAGHLAACIATIKQYCPQMKLEMLLQDFRGAMNLLERVIDAGPDVIAHNVECVERLSPLVRDAKAGYRQSLDVLAHAKSYAPHRPTKTSLMLGFGESASEILQTLREIRSVGVDILTLGQYLRPTGSSHHLPVARYWSPEEFDELGRQARELGFLHVASGPFVRSSYRASELFLKGYLNSSLKTAAEASAHESN
jgi:lipoic acid synthetase